MLDIFQTNLTPGFVAHLIGESRLLSPEMTATIPSNCCWSHLSITAFVQTTQFSEETQSCPLSHPIPQQNNPINLPTVAPNHHIFNSHFRPGPLDSLPPLSKILKHMKNVGLLQVDISRRQPQSRVSSADIAYIITLCHLPHHLPHLFPKIAFSHTSNLSREIFGHQSVAGTIFLRDNIFFCCTSTVAGASRGVAQKRVVRHDEAVRYHTSQATCWMLRIVDGGMWGST